MESTLGKNILITGAAQGLGRELAILCAAEGSNLALIDIDDEKLKNTANELKKDGRNIRPYLCDLSKKDSIDTVTKEIKNDFNQIDIVINNAGVISGKSINDLSYDELKLTFDVNLLAIVWLTKQFLPEMISRNEGHIVNVSSVAGLVAAPKMGDYCASKFGVVGFSDALRMEMKKFNTKGVKVSCICPSLIGTDMFKGFKTPFFAPALNPKKLAEKIINQAIKKEKPYVLAPASAYILPFVKTLPTKMVDAIARIGGSSNAMDTFKGHGN